ncbi:MAG: hypothetical protein AB1779_05445 [Candidatus Thermoplasmatota archaeon]
MDEKKMLILDYCKDGYLPINPLLSKIPKSSLYLYIDELMKEGCIIRKKGKYKTTQKGVDKLRESKGSTANEKQKSSLPMSLHEQTKTLIVESEENTLDYDMRVKQLKNKLESIGITQDVIDNFSAEKIKDLVELDGMLRNKGITIVKARGYVQLHFDLEKLGFDLNTAKLLATELSKTKVGMEKAIQKIKWYVDKFLSLEGAIKSLEQSRTKLENEMKIKSEKANNLCNHVLRLKNEAGELEEEILLLEKEKEDMIRHLDKINTDIKMREDELRKIRLDLSSILKVSNDTAGIIKGIERINSEKTNLEREIKVLKENYDKTQQDLVNILAVRNSVEEIRTGIEKLKSEKVEMETKVNSLKQEIEKLTAQHKELEDDIAGYKAWREFLLSGKIPSYEYSIWSDMETLVKIHRGEAKYLEMYKDNISERVWKNLLLYHKKLVEENIVSKWDAARLIEQNQELENTLKYAVDTIKKLKEENEKLKNLCQDQ